MQRNKQTDGSKKRPTPRGVGGLKFPWLKENAPELVSHPTRGGWIEILAAAPGELFAYVPPHAGWVD